MLRKTILAVGSILMILSITAKAEKTDAQIDIFFDITLDLLKSKLYDSAYQIAEEAYMLAKTSNYSWGKANSQYIKGWCRFKQNKNSEALLLFLESLRVLQDELPPTEKTFARTGLHMNIGRIYNIYSNYEGAHKFYNQGLEIARIHNHKLQEIKFLYNNGVSFKYEGKPAKAAEFFIQTKHLALAEKSDRWYFNAINQLGLINKDVNRYDSARQYYQNALTIVDNLDNSSRYRAMIHHNIGVSYLLEENFMVAEMNFKMALGIRESFLTQKDLSELYYKTGRFDKAFELGKKAIAKYHDEDLTPENASIYKITGNSAIAIGEYRVGAKYIDEYTTEINKYLENREYTKKLEDAYQIDLLTKQYFLKLEQQKRQAQIIQLSWFFGAVVLAFILLFFAQRWYQRRKKADATDAIKAIFNQSDILRGSLDREV